MPSYVQLKYQKLDIKNKVRQLFPCVMKQDFKVLVEKLTTEAFQQVLNGASTSIIYAHFTFNLENNRKITEIDIIEISRYFPVTCSMIMIAKI